MTDEEFQSLQAELGEVLSDVINNSSLFEVLNKYDLPAGKQLEIELKFDTNNSLEDTQAQFELGTNTNSSLTIDTQTNVLSMFSLSQQVSTLSVCTRKFTTCPTGEDLGGNCWHYIDCRTRRVIQ